LIFRLVGRDEVAVLVSTPYMDEAIRCNRVGFMSQGELIVEGSPQQITQRLEGRVLELVGGRRAAMRTAASADADVEDVQVFGDRLHLRVRPGTAGVVQERLPGVLAAAGGAGVELRPIAPTLEDAFIELIERQGD
jgi:ABC-2 type transport system ATP-binding protein